MDMRVQKLLYSIGLTANYTGYRQMTIALEIASQEPESLCQVTKWLYPETARRCGTNWKAVERNIRTALHRTWKTSQHTLEQMAGYSFNSVPKPAEFLAILTKGLSDWN
ncbi:sporulation initiation factor Spo0A C-terminal domain-containing protein [Pseudoflavonifractor sp. HCP28S3_F10]|uniref:sporulation initiation factor Spo0A C-terminal domain-containing protein n=1 Tax=Pseudoflavonifractor sp. HCP28S3_F10 TaxID=3438947 RepID=UPI003F8A72F1